MWFYSDKVMELFKNPKNVGEIENPDAIGEVGNIVCGDALKITLKIDKNTNRIIDAKFKTFGCASAIASSSALTEMIKGKTLEEALKISNKDIADYLGGLPEEKMHCSVMGQEALEKAIYSYLGKEVKEDSSYEEGEIVCKCFGVTDKKILRAVRENNLHTVEEVTNYTKAGGGCGKCKPKIQALLDEFWAKQSTKDTKKDKKQLTNLERINLIQSIVEKEIRPNLKKDGGDIEIIDIDRNVVYVRFLGTCRECPAVNFTLKNFVETKLRETVSDDIIVEER